MAMQKIEVLCPGCDGDKTVTLNGVPNQPCPACRGTGKIEKWVSRRK